MTWLVSWILCVFVIIQAAAAVALPAFFTEYYTTNEGIVDAGIQGKWKIASMHLLI